MHAPPPLPPLSPRRGFSLLELVLVLAVLSLLLLVALPRLSAVLDSIAVESAAQRVAALHARARITAVIENRVVVYGIAADSLRLGVVAGGDTAWRAATPGPAAAGVTLTGPTRRVLWSPVGVALGVSNGTWVLARGSARRAVVVSRLGRLRIQR
jgi:prepilin-type N-terminal cleavage/methylation domain-containing protein